jgi:glycosyl hydrolase family 20
MKFRNIAFQVDVARQIETPSTLKRIIDFGGSVGYNELFLYGEGALEYKSHTECSSQWALTQKKFLDLQKYAADEYGMRLVPVIPVLGHANFILNNKKLEHLREVKNPDDAIVRCNMRQFCPSIPESYKVIEEILAEWAEITSAPYLHIGGDESWNFAVCPECRKKAGSIGRGKMLAEYFNQINAIVRKHGKQTMIWHDMLFYFDDCLPHLDNDIIICDWHYKPVERHPGISIYNWIKIDFSAEYRKQGLPFFVCPKSKCNYPEETANIKSFLEYSQNRKPAGFLNTVWEMSGIPYASCYPSLAYAAACCQRDDLPDPRAFLHQFAKEHFTGEVELLPLLVDLFSETAELQPFSGLDNWINYQDSGPDLLLAGKLDEAMKMVKKVRGKTIPGKAYREALELIFKRMAIAKRLQGMVNEIAVVYLAGSPVKNKIANKLAEISSLLDKIQEQIKLEEKVWNKNRYSDQNNPIVKQWNAAEETLREFIKSVRKILSGKAKATSVFPSVLELTLVNNDCSWQELTIFSSGNGSKYHKIGSYPQCGPFGRYTKTFKLPDNGKFIKLELAGLGQLLVHYARVIGPGLELIPEKILKTEGAVLTPEKLLVDDFKPALMGSVESSSYFSNGQEQPKSLIEIKNKKA